MRGGLASMVRGERGEESWRSGGGACRAVRRASGWGGGEERSGNERARGMRPGGPW